MKAGVSNSLCTALKYFQFGFEKWIKFGSQQGEERSWLEQRPQGRKAHSTGGRKSINTLDRQEHRAPEGEEWRQEHASGSHIEYLEWQVTETDLSPGRHARIEDCAVLAAFQEIFHWSEGRWYHSIAIFVPFFPTSPLWGTSPGQGDMHVFLSALTGRKA